MMVHRLYLGNDRRVFPAILPGQNGYKKYCRDIFGNPCKIEDDRFDDDTVVLYKSREIAKNVLSILDYARDLEY